MPNTITSEELRRDLALRDLTDPAEGRHALQVLIDHAVVALAEAWHCGIRIARGPRIVSLEDNYDGLGFPAEAVTRDARYTRYVDDTHMLRSHASTMVPPALRQLSVDPAEDVLIVCPGVTFRRDSIDRLHTGTPHQLDLWRLSRHSLGNAEMEEMMTILASTLIPGLPWRQEARTHPYTLEGRQVDAESGNEWVEVWECGLANPDVLERAGLRNHTGLALGMGLDRLLMLRKNIPDIRLLRSGDERVVSQMRDLRPFREVSNLPAVVRDISVAVDAADVVEDVGDRVRRGLGEDADMIEAVAVMTETSFDRLPAAAIERLGMTASQKNLLVRLLIRPFGRTLTDGEANDIRDRAYAAIHQGSGKQWWT